MGIFQCHVSFRGVYLQGTITYPTEREVRKIIFKGALGRDMFPGGYPSNILHTKNDGLENVSPASKTGIILGTNRAPSPVISRVK